MHPRRRQSGATMTEAIIVFPVLVLLTLTIVQWALIYHARATLNYAALMAARYGAVHHASVDWMRHGLARGLVPLYRPDHNLQAVRDAVEGPIAADLLAYSKLCVVSPSEDAFNAWEIPGPALLPGIPNLWQQYDAPKKLNGIDIRDANRLEVEVRFGYPMIVPYVSAIFANILDDLVSSYDADELAWLAERRIPIKASATVRMQSEARRAEVQGQFCP